MTIGQSEDKSWVEVQTGNELKRLEVDYIVGCDGANSQIRKSLFGDWNFPSKTWDEQIVATNVSVLCCFLAWQRLSGLISLLTCTEIL